MDTHNAALQTLTADITMVKYDSVLQQPTTLAGKTNYLPKRTKGTMAFRLDWATEDGHPKQESISVVGENVELYQPRLNLVKKGKTQKSKSSKGLGSALSFLSMSRDEVTANYDVKYLGDEQIKTGERTWHLELTPLKTASYKDAEIWVDKDGMPRQIKVIEANNDYTAVLLSNIQKNVKMDVKIFKLDYPKGTTIQPF
jgi:outer membrane lipoprotein-sorting protein